MTRFRIKREPAQAAAAMPILARPGPLYRSETLASSGVIVAMSVSSASPENRMLSRMRRMADLSRPPQASVTTTGISPRSTACHHGRDADLQGDTGDGERHGYQDLAAPSPGASR